MARTCIRWPSSIRELEHIVLDHLAPPIAHYLTRQTLEQWFAELRPVALPSLA